jgi:hypothetical protein
MHQEIDQTGPVMLKSSVMDLEIFITDANQRICNPELRIRIRIQEANAN